MSEGTRAEASTRTQRRFEPQHLHDGTWWATGEPCATLAAAIPRAKTADPDHCNGGVIRVVEVVMVTKSTQVWDDKCPK
jgi:hypothetical protein